MNKDIYNQLANALGKLPNGFPRTPSNVEISLLKKNFPPEEALLASQLRGNMESIGVIAQRVGLSVEEARTKLMEMGTASTRVSKYHLFSWNYLDFGRLKPHPTVAQLSKACP